MIRKMHQIIHPDDYQSSFHVYFLIGQPQDPFQSVESQLQNEISQFEDIIEFDQLDSYDTLPDKTFAGYQFFAEKCPDKQYVAFIDDDVFIKVRELKKEMKKLSGGTFRLLDNFGAINSKTVVELL